MKARFEHIPPGQTDPDPLPGDFILTHGPPREMRDDVTVLVSHPIEGVNHLAEHVRQS